MFLKDLHAKKNRLNHKNHNEIKRFRDKFILKIIINYLIQTFQTRRYFEVKGKTKKTER